jgi:hypothetical protein
LVTEQAVPGGPAHRTQPGHRVAGPTRATPRTLALGVAGVLAVLVPLLATLDLHFYGQPLLATLFMILVPGVPVMLCLRLSSGLATAALAVALSFGYHVLYGTFAIVESFWYPVGGSWFATLIALVFTVLALRQDLRTTPAVAAREARPRAGVADRMRMISVGAILVAALLWFWETRTVVLDDAAAYGLFEVVSWRYLLALVVLAAVTGYTLFRARVDHLVMTLAMTVWALIGYATVPVADGHGSVPVGWVHVAFVQYISENGTVPASYDARFSWPGFFAAAAQLVSLGGTQDAGTYLVLAPVVYFLAAVPGLLLIARTITHSWRWSWVAVLIFVLTNWYQQDYFSPQATALVIYVAVIGTLLWMIDTAVVPRLRGNLAGKIVGALKRTPALPAGMSVRTAQALGVVLAVLCAGLVVDHQLTPFTMIFALVGFAATGLTRYRLLWVTTGLIFVGYFSYGAIDFWIGHLDGLLGDVGQVGNAIEAGVGGRIVGDPTYQSNQFVRIGWSVLLFALGAVGVWTLRRRREALLLAGLACAPFALLVVQSYGGEVVIRSFLYASPILAPLAACALRGVADLVRARRRDRVDAPAGSRTIAIRTAALIPVLVIAGLVLTFTRGLNAAFERTPPEQAVAAKFLYERAVPGDKVALPLFAGLTPYQDILEVRPQFVTAETCVGSTLTECINDPLPRFVLLTHTQERTGQLTRSRSEGWVWELGQQLIDSGEYTRIYEGTDAWLLERTSQEGS